MNKPENEKKQSDAQFRQLQELKFIGLLAGGIVHSLNNVIGVIHGYADLALRATSSSECSYAYLEQIIKEAVLAKDLAGKIGVFARQKKPDFKLIDIHPIVGQEIKIFRESLPASIDIQQDMDMTGTIVLADAGQIRQVVINLCDNAHEAMCENGGILKVILKEVDVTASFAEEYKYLTEGKYVKLTVSDTGRGINQEILERIFEPFSTTKKSGEGAGLGLSVVHQIVKNHKGEIIVKSNPGEGTTLDIYLPLANKDHGEKEG